MESFSIVFDNSHSENVFYAGQDIIGKVYLELSEPLAVRCVWCHIRGVAQANFVEGQDQLNGVPFFGEEVLLDQKFTLWPDEVPKSRYKEDSIQLTSGTHEFPFICSLPLDSLTSVELMYGRVRYTVKAVLDKPWELDTVTKRAFTVIGYNDSYSNKALLKAFTLESCKKFSKWVIAKETVSIKLTYPKLAYSPGECAAVNIEVDNKSSKTITLRLALQQHALYVGKSFHGKDAVSSSLSEVHSVTLAKSALPHKVTKYVPAKILVPAVAPSMEEDCGVLSVAYRLGVIIATDKFKDEPFSVFTRIVLGTMTSQAEENDTKYEFVESTSDVDDIREGEELRLIAERIPFTPQYPVLRQSEKAPTKCVTTENSVSVTSQSDENEEGNDDDDDVFV